MDNDQDITFTHDELVAALLEAQYSGVDENSGVLTGPELADILRISDKTAQKRVKKLLKSGTIEVAKKRIINTLGIETTTRGYRLVDK